jgi:putative membrane protein
MVYTFLLAFPCTGLAALLTFARAPFYPFYVSAPHTIGFDALQDQHLGGLLMWLPTHLILLLALGTTFFKWFRNANRVVEQNIRQIS